MSLELALKALIAEVLREAQNPSLNSDATPITPAPVVAQQPKPRGRPPKGPEGGVTAATPAAVAAPTGVAAPATPATPASTNLTRAIVAESFKAAAAAHGRDFGVACLKAHNAATFDKVPQAEWPQFKAALDAGPHKAAAPADPVADLMG